MIFISIDDGEQALLKLFMNEVFGEENYIGTFVVNATPNARDYGHIAKMHEYVHFYCKNIEMAETNELEIREKVFRFHDDRSGFNIHPLYNSNEAFNSGNRPNLFFPIYLYPEEKLTDCVVNSSSDPADCFFRIGFEKRSGSVQIYPSKSEKNSVQFVWRWGKQKCSENFNKEIVGYRTDQGDYRIVQKLRHTTKLIRSMIDSEEVTTRRGTAEVEGILGGKIATFPKPTGLIRTLVQAGINSNDIVLDFFAGSGTTAHAVLDLNKQDGGSRKFILVQLPEPLDPSDKSQKSGADFCDSIGKPRTIAEITKERVRRVITKLNEEDGDDAESEEVKAQDRGFRVYKLAESNFRPWDADIPRNAGALGSQLELHIDHIRDGRTTKDILYEILLKSGFPLTTQVETLTLAGKTVYSMADGALLLCLDREITLELIRAMAEQGPERVVCLDEGFAGNDQLKTNAVQIFKTKGVTSFKTI